MNATPVRTAPQTVPPAAPEPMVVVAFRREHRARDFGVGYGSSSGYATDRHYLRDHVVPRFRCA